MILSAIFILITILGILTYTFLMLRSIIKPKLLNKNAKLIYKISASLYWIAPLAFITLMSLSKGKNIYFSSFWHKLIMSYLPLLAYIIFIAIIWGIIRLIYKLIIKYKPQLKISENFAFKNKTYNRSRLILLIYFVIISIIMPYGQWKSGQIMVSKKDLSLTKNPTQSKRILLMADIHFDPGFSDKYAEKLTSLVNQQQADLILISGDFADLPAKELNRRGFDKVVQSWKAKQGVYGVIGNHEVYNGLERTVKWMEDQGVIILKDSSVKIDDLNIVGRYDITVEKNNLFKRKSIAELTKHIPKSEATIVMDHQPIEFMENLNAGVDLMLSGHTHGGQFFPFSLAVMSIFEIYKGYAFKENTLGEKLHIYVCQGTGTWGPGFRLGTNNEIVVIDIKY